MPIKDLQQRLAQVGVIRLGEQRLSRNNKPMPVKLETLRFTSPSRPLIEGVAQLYDGEVKAWASNTGQQWEVITHAKEIPVLVPPQTVDPNYELWGNGFRSRLCDGETEQIRNQPCMCAAQFGPDFTKKAPPGQACKPTTRMSLMLADLVSLGTWKLESHGWNAAAELPMLASAIANATRPIPARLEVQARQKKILHPDRPPDKQIETRNYMVPVLHFDFVTPAQAFSGQIGAAAQAALGGGEQPAAIESKPTAGAAPEKLTSDRVVALARLATDQATLKQLGARAEADGALDDAARAALNGRWQALAPKPPQEASPAEVVEPELEPDGKAVFNEILELGAERGWNMPAIAERFLAFHGFDYRDDKADGFALAKFRDAVKAGEIQ